jgi:deazaflavin-dependent oxidoreductase (nitroreductase family)
MNNPDIFRQGFRYLNHFMLLLWRLGLGPWLSLWPKVGGRFMVIAHTGRKTGQIRRTPVNYTAIDGEVYCTAGFGRNCDWYQNIKAEPQVEIWLQDGWWRGLAEEVTVNHEFLPILRAVLFDSGFAAPLFGVNPYTLSDAQLAEIARDYRLIHFRRIAERTGADGPGDLAWIWPLATFILLPLAFRRNRK